MSVAAPTATGRVRALVSHHAAAIYGMIGRLWLILTGPVTIVFLAVYFSPDAQGYFLTFITLAAARSVAELGLGQVIIVKIAQLHSSTVDPVAAVTPRVAGLIRFTAKWFAGAGLLIGAVLGLSGSLLLGTGKGLPVAEWLPQWIALSCLVGIDVALSGLLYPLEGAGQVRSVYFCRMVRSVANSLVLWLFILLGFQLWSISAGLAAGLVWTAFYVFSRGRLVIAALRPGAAVAKIDWFSEVFPAQWRIALSSIADYLSFYTVVPLMYVMHGAVIAGQVGVTWQLALAVSAVAGAFVLARLPEFSRLAGTRSIRELDTLFVSTSLISMAVCFIGALGVGLCVLVLDKIGTDFAARLLPFDEVVVFLLGVLIWHFNLTIVAYLRAHGGDPYLPASLAGAALLLAANVTLGRWFGPAGLLCGYTLIGTCIMVPFSFYLLLRKRRTCGYPPFKVEGSWTALLSRSR
ncbi:MAG: hypothetical protein QOE49_5433 [Rhodospirillaceae bacterium]|jgi:hypothetical protein|nr:hypothetical protein [Rhodospirillaceae bacterium]